MHRKSTSWILTALIVAVGLVGLPSRVMATAINLSDASSDATDPDLLDADVDFDVLAALLTVTVTNQTTAPDEYNINQIFFNAADNVGSLGLVSAIHSVAGDVFSDWSLNVARTKAGTFGKFDFALRGPKNKGENNPSIIGPGEIIVFTFMIFGTGPFDMADFIERSVTRSGNAAFAAAKFVNGRFDDSAFGAGLEEPGTEACCLVDALDYIVCIDITRELCLDGVGTPLGPGTTCALNPCIFP